MATTKRETGNKEGQVAISKPAIMSQRSGRLRASSSS
jgi:hypothetical protein